MSAQTTQKVISVIRIVFLAGIAFFFMYPFVYMIMKSLDEMSNFGLKIPPVLRPEKFGLNNYTSSLRLIRIGRYYFNTIYVALWVTFIHLLTGVMAGYALSKGRFRFKRFWLLVILSTMMIPLEAIVMTRFLLFKDLGLVNTYTGLILPTLSYPFGVFLSKQYIDGLPDSLGEAARIDGANEWLIYFKVYLPLTGPVLATLAILSIMSEWNSLMWPLIMLTKSSMFTISVGIAFFNQTEMMRPVVGNALAIATMAIFPVFIAYLFLQKYIIQSIAVSGIKQ
jgi:multiple sugar transport system permease protein